MNITATALAQSASAASEPGILFVAIMGICTVIIGLVCIILLCVVMSKVCQLLSGAPKQQASAVPSAKTDMPAPAVPSTAPIPNKGELIAAITAAVAEELGTDISAIRVHSLRRVGAPVPAASIPNKGELVAAITAAVAEELGTDISAIRVHSLRKIG